MSITALRTAVTTAGGTPSGYDHVTLLRQLITAWGGTPAKWSVNELLRDAITLKGGTPNQWLFVPLLRQLVTTLGGTPATYQPDALMTQIAGLSASSDVTAPTITSANSASVAENATLSHALTANETVTWSITGGADSARFELSGSTLRWASNGTKDYETPNDADTNNTYIVQVTATDAASNATNQTITVTVTDVAEYETETTALVARMSSTPDSTRQGHINTLIAALKTAGVWSKLDVLYILAAADAQAAKLNWKSTSYNATESGTLTFTADRGYTGNGSTGILDTAFNPSTAGGNYARDTASMSVWCGTNVTSSAHDCGNNAGSIIARLSGNTLMRASATVQNTNALGVADSTGWTAWSRTGSTNYNWVKNNGAPATVTQASTLMTSANFYVCGGNGLSTFSTRRVQAFHCGSGLSDAELASFYTALAAYMTAVGA